MSSETDGESLIAAFFAALEQRHLDQCAAVSEQLRILAQHQPGYRLWHLYFDGILANERDRNWARSEQIFSHLLEDELDHALQGPGVVSPWPVLRLPGAMARGD